MKKHVYLNATIVIVNVVMVIVLFFCNPQIASYRYMRAHNTSLLQEVESILNKFRFICQGVSKLDEDLMKAARI